jgi:hypothetical protein
MENNQPEKKKLKVTVKTLEKKTAARRRRRRATSTLIGFG